ncbi:hypothetical protein Acr_10g0009480 [Actinidia rufa]|uniref:Uncharacterized protein n=1 Tax=Actinidia rufa TaxID=165716 RepID=A0A7J0FAC6_9ERIC|nr:hypothetical protein Acr_10g0009480 [Actinidia rufa]
MAEHSLGSMILLSAMNYAIWKPRMEDILFYKDLHDSLENKRDKPVAAKDEEWKKMNRKTIGLIRQCPTASEFLSRDLGDIGSFSQQFSAEWEVDYEYGCGCPSFRGKQGKRLRSRKRSSQDSKGCNFDASGETLRVSKGNKEMLWGKKTGGLCRLEGSVQIGGVTVRYGSSGIREKNG